MRFAAAILLTACTAPAQFKSTSTLVLAPTTIVDSKGHYVDGLEAKDLVLFDNNVAQPIQVDEAIYPISLVVAVQTSVNSQAVIDKLGGSGILFTELLAGNAGETAILTFGDTVHDLQDFTTDPSQLEKTLRSLHVNRGDAASLDAVAEALKLLEQRKPERRRVILLIAEKRDRASQRKFAGVLREVQRQNVLIYWLTYSPTLTAYTARPRTVKSADPKKDGELVPYDPGSQNLLNIIPELAQLGKPAAAQELAKATGGRSVGFLKQDALEEAIQSVAAEVHRQYMVSFQPRPSPPGKFHSIRVEVKGKPELLARTRAGYWPLQ
ncbi:MAG TPA: VWA domain-containing protein [Candidatus Acidoferrales bacterium]|jgi:VWFA-related protein|nr:VWA domain-containing protein [Candidatus Acidoferrales bacterium]